MCIVNNLYTEEKNICFSYVIVHKEKSSNRLEAELTIKIRKQVIQVYISVLKEKNKVSMITFFPLLIIICLVRTRTITDAS
jgi:hypothetical protein